MDQRPPDMVGANNVLSSGPEIVAGFLRELAERQNLDKDTVNAILSLRANGKLNDRNLLKSLELSRAAQRK